MKLELDRKSAEVHCHFVDQKREAFASGEESPGFWQIYENAHWRIARTPITFTACTAGDLYLWADEIGSQAEIDYGPPALDRLIEAVLEIEPASMIDTELYDRQQEAFYSIVPPLEQLSDRLAEIVPTPEGATREVWTPFNGPASKKPESLLGVPALFQVVDAPNTKVTFDMGACTVQVSLSASVGARREARPRRRAADGFTTESRDYVIRNTDRFYGKEMKDGSMIAGVLTDGPAIRIAARGKAPCPDHSALARALFDEILLHDLEDFVVVPLPEH